MNIIRVMLTLLSLILTSKYASSQLNLHFHEFNLFVKPQKCNDTLNLGIGGEYKGDSIIIYLRDCRGESFFKIYGKEGKLRLSGYYSNSIDTLKRYSFSKSIRDSDSSNYRVWAIKYFQPLRSGTWTYYDKRGKVYKSVKYVFRIE